MSEALATRRVVRDYLKLIVVIDQERARLLALKAGGMTSLNFAGEAAISLGRIVRARDEIAGVRE